MKKKFLRVFAILCVLVMMLCISGCYNPNESMDDAREKYAYYTDDTLSCIRFDGKNYIKYEKDIDFDVFDAGTAYLTDKGVPAIMASVEGSAIWYNKNRTALLVNDWAKQNEAIYVQEGFEDEFEAIVESGVHEFYCTNDPLGDGEYGVATGDKKEAIEKTLESAPLTADEIPKSTEHASSYWIVDKDFTLANKNGFVVYKANGGFYFDTGYGWYKVPSEYSELFVDEYEKNYYGYEDFEYYYGEDGIYDSII